MSSVNEEHVESHPPRRRASDTINLKLVVSLTATVAAIIGMLVLQNKATVAANDRLITAIIQQIDTQHRDNLASQKEIRAAIENFGQKQQELSETIRQYLDKTTRR